MNRTVVIEIGTLVVTDFDVEVATRLGHDLRTQLAAALAEARGAGELPRSNASIDSLRLRFEAPSMHEGGPLAAGAARALVQGIRK